MQTRDIPLASQNQIKKWAKLDSAKYRASEGLFPAEGVKIFNELLKSPCRIDAVITLSEKMDLLNTPAMAGNIPVYQASRADFKKLSQDKEPEGILAYVQKPASPDLPDFLQSAAGHLLIGHEIANPQNLGALLRTAWWFGFSGVILSEKSVDWTHPKVIRASMGAAFHLTILSGVNLALAIPEIIKTHRLIGSDVRTGNVPAYAQGKAALMLGSESHGLPDDLLDHSEMRWRIPGADQAESLSLPQAAAIMMYEMTKTRTKEQE